MKRIISVMLVLCLSLMLFAQGGSEAAAADSSGAWTPKGGNVNIIVPFGAGGSSDLTVRAIVNNGAKYFPDTTLVVENVPGGGCAIGLTKFVTSKPDGFTIGNTSTPMVVLPTSTTTQPYVYYEMVEPICRSAVSTFVVYVRSDSGIYNLEDLKNEILSREMILACNSNGGNSHWEMEYFAMKNGGDVTAVVYDGGASAIAAVLGGHADITVQAPNDGREYVRSGDLRAIAVLNTERLTDSVYADVPTSVEQGYPWLTNVGFQGFSLPKGTPQNIIDFYRECFRNALADPVIMEETEKLGMIPAYLDADEFSAFIDESVANYKEIFSALEGRLD